MGDQQKQAVGGMTEEELRNMVPGQDYDEETGEKGGEKVGTSQSTDIYEADEDRMATEIDDDD